MTVTTAEPLSDADRARFAAPAGRRGPVHPRAARPRSTPNCWAGSCCGWATRFSIPPSKRACGNSAGGSKQQATHEIQRRRDRFRDSGGDSGSLAAGRRPPRSAACWKSATASPAATAWAGPWPARWSRSPPASTGWCSTWRRTPSASSSSETTWRIREGETVKTTGQLLSVPVGEALIGRVVSPLGEPLDGAGPIVTADRRPLETAGPRRGRPPAGDRAAPDRN